MRFLVDAQLPPALAQFLREFSHDAEHVHEIGLTRCYGRCDLASGRN